tara:strand:- start:2286 stop:2531 length:246 start_codon:yes stop_codon:yes gene_type:complete
MKTVKLEISKKIYNKVIWLLKQFKPEELRIVNEEETNFEIQKSYLQEQLESIDNQTAKFISTAELGDFLDKTIERYGNSNT